MLGTLVDDLAWCWWTRPRAVQLGDLLYLGGIDSVGNIVVATWDQRTGAREQAVVARFEADDHNNPAVVVDADRPVVTFYSRHDEDDALRYRRSAGPLDISAWSAERSISFGGITTYAQVHPRGDELHLLTRVADIGWHYGRSGDWGETWEPTRAFLVLDTNQETYLASTLLADGTTLRIAIAGHPKEYRDRPLHDVWTCLVDLASGDVTLPGGGPAIANLRSGAGLPLSEQQLERVFRCPADRTLNLFDISGAPATEIAFVTKKKSDHATEDARYHVSRATADGWVTDDLVPAGAIFGYIHAGFYAGGMAFPPGTPGGEVYLSREEGGQWSLEQWLRADAGWTARALAGPGPERIVRPWGVTGADGPVGVLALALEEYGDDYMDTRSRLVGTAPATVPAGG